MANPYVEELRRRARNLVSLDSPTDTDLADFGADLALGFVPVVGTAQAGRDFERARREKDTLGMVLSAAAGVPIVGGVAKAANKSRKAGALSKALRSSPQSLHADQLNKMTPEQLNDLADNLYEEVASVSDEVRSNGPDYSVADPVGLIYDYFESNAGKFKGDWNSIVREFLAQHVDSGQRRVGDALRTAGRSVAQSVFNEPSAVREAAKSAAKVDALRGYDPAKVALDYPDRAPPVMKLDKKKGEEFLGKDLSPEAKAVQKARKAAQKEIDAGNYTPYFNVDERYYVDASKYPLQGDTLTDALPKKQATIDKYKARFDKPEVRQRLQAAFLRGNADPKAQRWYAMGQLEKAYTDELGEEAGRAAFKTDFADAMAATTGGADPTDNLMMAHYGNFQRARGQAIPDKAYDLPFPIGGRYAGGNLEMYDKVINRGRNFVAGETPKRFNFSANFQGHRNRATIDEQMSGGFEKGLKAPPGDSYGVMEGIVGDIARQNKVPAAEAQDVMWAGLKGTAGKPMIQHVNEAIERTARITGLSPDEVLRKNLIRKMGPLYGVGAAGVGTAALMSQDEESL